MKTALDYVYLVMGLFVIWVAYANFRDKGNRKRITSGLFWLILGVLIAFGGLIPHLYNGILVAALAVLAAIGGVQPGSQKEASHDYRWSEAEKLGAKPLLAVLIIPVITFAFTPLKNVYQAPLVGLGLSSALAGLVALVLTRDNLGSMMVEGRRITDSMSWTVILPPYLAALGAVFNAAGVGPIVAGLVSKVFPVNVRIGAVVAYALGMALFTIVMGNAFAAFAVITTGIGIPIVIAMHGARPEVIAPLAMTAGYCGTLCTVMAANFNMVPAALLELKDKYAVIKEQLVIAIPLWVIHCILMYLIAF